MAVRLAIVVVFTLAMSIAGALSGAHPADTHGRSAGARVPVPATPSAPLVMPGPLPVPAADVTLAALLARLRAVRAQRVATDAALAGLERLIAVAPDAQSRPCSRPCGGVTLG